MPHPLARYIEENVRERVFGVDHNFAGWRLDQFLHHRLQRLSRSKAAEIIRHGDLRLDPPRRPKPSLKLGFGDRVILREHLAPEWVQDAQVEVVHRDEAMIVLNKPAGMLVHESASVRLNTMQLYLHRHGEPEAEPVHRLDRETSGVLVCARTHAMVAPLRELFASDHPHKIYRALVHDPQGMWQGAGARTLCWPLGPQTQNELELRMGPGELDATTHVRWLGSRVHPRWGGLSDLEVRIETGRQHQIRVHLEMAGTPVAGDKLYGQSDEFFMRWCADPEDPRWLEALPFARHALHAWKIRLPHPIDGSPFEALAPVPGEVWGEF